MICKFCGVPIEPDDLLHMLRCDGQQGAVEAAAAIPSKPVMVTISKPRETSVQAFYNAVDTGTILTRREQVYAALREIPGATANETFVHLKERHHLGLRYDSNTRARFTELRDLGVIRETGERACRVTGQLCITWEVVPSNEYRGTAIIRRCPTCGQIVARDVPDTAGAMR